MDPVFANNREKYLFHLEEFKKFKETRTRYCEKHDLKLHMFSYYQNSLVLKSAPAFAKIKIETCPDLIKLPPAKSNIFIDPAWLAKFIHNLANMK